MLCKKEKSCDNTSASEEECCFRIRLFTKLHFSDFLTTFFRLLKLGQATFWQNKYNLLFVLLFTYNFIWRKSFKSKITNLHFQAKLWKAVLTLTKIYEWISNRGFNGRFDEIFVCVPSETFLLMIRKLFVVVIEVARSLLNESLHTGVGEAARGTPHIFFGLFAQPQNLVWLLFNIGPVSFVLWK